MSVNVSKVKAFGFVIPYKLHGQAKCQVCTRDGLVIIIVQFYQVCVRDGLVR